MRITEIIIESAKRLTAAGVEVSRVNKEDFAHIKNKLNPLLQKAGITAGWTSGGAGSFDPEHEYGGGGREDSGDVDIMIDPEELLEKFTLDLEEYNKNRKTPLGAKAFANMMADEGKKKIFTLSAAKWALSEYLSRNGFDTDPGTLTVNFAGSGKNYSVDLIVRPRSAWPLHTHDFTRDPGMRGGDLWVNIYPLLAKVASKTVFTDPKTGEEKGNLQFSPDRGLVDRDNNEVVAIKKDDIAKILLGPAATGRDLASISGIRDQLEKDPAKWSKTKQLFQGANQ
jgi:hypothetical protein